MKVNIITCITYLMKLIVILIIETLYILNITFYFISWSTGHNGGQNNGSMRGSIWIPYSQPRVFPTEKTGEKERIFYYFYHQKVPVFRNQVSNFENNMYIRGRNSLGWQLTITCICFLVAPDNVLHFPKIWYIMPEITWNGSIFFLGKLWWKISLTSFWHVYLIIIAKLKSYFNSILWVLNVVNFNRCTYMYSTNLPV